MKITKEDVGREVVLRNGEVLTIFNVRRSICYPIICTDGRTYGDNGNYWAHGGEDELDIIAWHEFTDLTPEGDILMGVPSESQNSTVRASEGSTLTIGIQKGTELLEGVFEDDKGSLFEISVKAMERK